MTKKKTLTQRQNDVEEKLDILIDLIKQQQTATLPPPPPEPKPDLEPYIKNIVKMPPPGNVTTEELKTGKQLVEEKEKNYGRKELFVAKPRQNKFNDDFSISPELRVSIKPHLGAPGNIHHRPKAGFVKVTCGVCSKKEVIASTLYYGDKVKYRCSSCCGQG